jgi:predicted nucleic acid-binding protein
MLSVYIETTVPSFYFETRSGPRMVAWRQATRRWWDEFRGHYKVVTSEFVLAELRRAPQAKAKSALGLIADVPLLKPTPEVFEAAMRYAEERLMPSDALGDAAHLAIASAHGVDVLLTWNCRHLANANKASHIRALNERLGLPVPMIVTPMNLIPEQFP